MLDRAFTQSRCVIRELNFHFATENLLLIQDSKSLQATKLGSVLLRIDPSAR